MSCYVVAPASAAPNAFRFLTCCAIADAQCHVLSSWVDSILIYIQPACRIIHTSWTSFNRGAAEINVELRRSADITQEITGCERTAFYQIEGFKDERIATEQSG
jgi:hypothetical protein